ncbi:MAG TPA: hypothetical protein VF432_22810 [Thermoanaerobaculia bacterium]
MRNLDPRKELLTIFGILVAAGAVAVAFFLFLMKGRTAAGGMLVLGAAAALLLAGGIGLMLRRRWAGLLVAAISLAAAAAYLAMLWPCRDCSPRVLFANVAVAALFAVPGVLILRWRRLLR